MDIFDVSKRTLLDFDKYLDLKTKESDYVTAKPARDENGKDIRESKDKLKNYQRIVKRDLNFQHPVWDSTYKAMTHDSTYKINGLEPFKPADPGNVGIAVVNVAESNSDGLIVDFDTYCLNEAASKEQQEKVGKVMSEFKKGKLKSGPGGKGGKDKEMMQVHTDYINTQLKLVGEPPVVNKKKKKKKSTNENQVMSFHDFIALQNK